jgi:5'-3' exonuclease
MKTYILVDSLNMFHRSRHVGGRDIDIRVGMAVHIMFNSIRKAWNDFNGDHVVFCLEGRSWRKDAYPPYKGNRKVKALQRTPREVEDDEVFFEAYDDMLQFFEHKTNCTVLQNPIAEADDLIAIWIKEHPNDKHIIISSDSDFVQLLSDNVVIYNGITEITYYHDHIENAKGERLEFSIHSNSKIKVGKPNPDFEPAPNWIDYAFFLKCIRGDTSDNIFSAYPGARMKGTKNKIGITEAFQDRNAQGFNYNNFMLQRWTDHEDVEHRVRDDYERNKSLIDLTAQPDEVKESCRQTIQEALIKSKVSGVGIHLMKFAGKYDLQRVANNAQQFAEIFNAHID